MDIATFRAIKTKLLRNLTSEQQTEAERRISYTLSILRQETMSEEAVAVIIASHPKQKEEERKTKKPICPQCGKHSVVYSSFGDRTSKNCNLCEFSEFIVD